jgi:hypothetical protein
MAVTPGTTATAPISGTGAFQPPPGQKQSQLESGSMPEADSSWQSKDSGNNSTTTSTYHAQAPSGSDYSNWNWEQVLNGVLGLTLPDRSEIAGPSSGRWTLVEVNSGGDTLPQIWESTWKDAGTIHKDVLVFVSPWLLQPGNPWDGFVGGAYNGISPAVTPPFDYRGLAANPRTFGSAMVAILGVEDWAGTAAQTFGGINTDLKGEASQFQGQAGAAFQTLINNLYNATNNIYTTMTSPVDYAAQVAASGTDLSNFLVALAKAYNAWKGLPTYSPLGALDNVLQKLATQNADGTWSIYNWGTTPYGSLHDDSAWIKIEAVAKQLWLDTVAQVLDPLALKAFEALASSYQNTARDLQPISAPMLTQVGAPNGQSALPNGNSSLLPNNFSLFPNNFSLLPNNFSLIPNNFSLLPSNFSLIPNNFSLLPNNFSLIPNNFSLLPNGGGGTLLNPNGVTNSPLNPNGGISSVLNPNGGISSVLNPNGGISSVLNPNGGTGSVLNPNAGVSNLVNPGAGVSGLLNPNGGASSLLNPNSSLLNPNGDSLLDQALRNPNGNSVLDQALRNPNGNSVLDQALRNPNANTLLNEALNSAPNNSPLDQALTGAPNNSALDQALNSGPSNSALSTALTGTPNNSALDQSLIGGTPSSAAGPTTSLPGGNFDVQQPSLVGGQGLVNRVGQGPLFQAGTSAANTTPQALTSGVQAPVSSGISTPATAVGQTQTSGAGEFPFYSPMGMGGMGGMGGGMGGNQERERTTWLAEDEDVWGTEPGVGVGVLRPDALDEPDTEDYPEPPEPSRRPHDRRTRQGGAF